MVATPPAGAQFDGQLPEPTPDSLGAALELLFSRLDGAQLSFGHGTDNAWDEAVQLLLAAMDLPPDAGDEVLPLPVSPAQWETVRAWSWDRIHNRRPLPYLTGRAWFAGLPFICDDRALVPRSPLAEVILNDYRPWWSGPPPHRILDLCCGGGSIGIAAAIHGEKSQVWLADIDEGALELARENIALHRLADRVFPCPGDLFAAVDGERFDLILANPPYVDRNDLDAMPAEYHAEPPRGLGSGDDGLDMARRILGRAVHFLNEGGMLFLEVGNSWEALDKALAAVPLTWLDFSSGGHGVLAARADELPSIAAALGS